MHLYELGYLVFGTVRSEQDYEKWANTDESEKKGKIVPIKLDTTEPEKV